MANAATETSVEVIRCGGTAWEWVRERAITESFPDRVMRLAREAGYEPTGCELKNGMAFVSFAHPTKSIATPGVLCGARDAQSVLACLRKWAGPDNQPEAVRARKARERMASEAKPSKPGAYVDILFNGVKCPTTGPEFVHLTSAAQAAELYGVGSAPHRAMVRAERDGLIVGARDTRTAPVVGTLQPGDVVEHSTGPIWRAVTEIVRSVDAQVLARDRLRDQLASGGVDCAETRAANVARVKAESDVVGQMQDAIRLVESWPMKRKRCEECGAAAELLPLIGMCCHCTHRGIGTVRHVERGPGIAVDNTPGPHEGACAWASPCWEEL